MRCARTVTAGDSKARKVAASAVAGAVKATATTRASAPLNIANKLPPDWSVGITAGQTSSEVHEAIARFR